MSQHLARFLFLGFVLTVGAGFAQDTRARVQGLITDTTQAVIAGANVTLKNDNTGVTATQQTSQSGVYLFVSIT